MGFLSSTLCLLLLPQLGGTPRGFGETEAFDRVSPSGRNVLHVEIATRNGSGPGRAVLVRDGRMAWSRTLPFALAEAVVDDQGFVAGYGWPQGRPMGGCIGPSHAREFAILVLDPLGEIVRERRQVHDGPVSDEVRMPYASEHDGAFVWAEALVDSDGFREALSARPVPEVPGVGQPTIWTVQIRGTPLRALAWRNTERTWLLVVDNEFEPVHARTLSRDAVLRSVAGGWLVIERDEASAYALRFERPGGDWIPCPVEPGKLVAREAEEAHRTSELWRPTSRVVLGGASPGARLDAWQASCVVASERVVVAEEKRFVAHVFDASTGNAVAAAVPPSELLVRKEITFGVSVAPAPAGGFRIRWGTRDVAMDGMPYARYDALGTFGGMEDRFDRRPYLTETWLPFASMDERWVEAVSELRLRERGAWAGPAIEHDAWGRWLNPISGASGAQSVSAAENGDAIVLVQRGERFALTIVPRGELPSKTVPLPDGFEPGWSASLAWDGTHAFLGDGAGLLLVLDTRDDSLRDVTLEGVEDLRVCDLHVVAETSELWLIDRVRHELVRFAL